MLSKTTKSFCLKAFICPTLSQFWRQKNFSRDFSGITSHGVLAPYENLEKIYVAIPRKRLDRWKGGRTEGHPEEETDPIL